MNSEQRDRRTIAYTSATIMLIASVFAPCAVARRIWMPFQDFDGIPLRAPVTLSLWDVLPNLATALVFVAGLFLLRKNLFYRSVQRQFEFAMPLVVIAGFVGALIGVPLRLQDTVDYGFSWGLAFFCVAAGVMAVVFFLSVRSADTAVATNGTTGSTLPDDECWSCGSTLSPDSVQCPNCGWPDEDKRQPSEPSDAPSPAGE